MAIFYNVFIKTIAIFISILFIIILSSLLIILIEKNDNSHIFISGNENSDNVIAIIELNGLIIEENSEFSNLTNPFIISPKKVSRILDNLKEISPKIIIFSINSPGGTVSASNNLYDVIKEFKKNNVEILVHTNELLASGGYWVAISADEIYASYGSIIGSIGVKGPDWFFYDKPKKISTGIFGNSIETEKSIKVFSSKAGKYKDIFNPFREPTKDELDHLQSMVDEIYDNFVRIVSKERKIEDNTIINEIGALIYTAKKAAQLHLINGELNITQLINFKIKKRGFDNYKVIKIPYSKNSFQKFITGSFKNNKSNIQSECLSLRSSISAILSYESIGC